MKAFLNWSSGKDAAFSFYKLWLSGKAPNLWLTTVNRQYGRVSMHGVDVRLLRRQAFEAGVQLREIPLSTTTDLETYDRIMREEVTRLKNQGYDTAVFGDIFLEDLKQYRIRQMNRVGMKCLFPVWGYDTRELAREIIRSGIRAVVVTVNARLMDRSFAGREFDESFLADLPEGVDPCGENGEFHTFVYDAPFFKKPIAIRNEGVVFREYKSCDDEDDPVDKDKSKWDTAFWFADLRPE
ncbi:MAG: adenine nucleotide alpha hydrolase [Chlorobi bacterium]|nr:adenine nucleotide alpha hydrolase [Chlorobiota bacterium]